MKNITFNYSHGFIKENEILQVEPMVYVAHDLLHGDKGSGNDFTGWLKLPTDYNKEEFDKIKICAQKIRDSSDVFVTIGIGGSYLGARSCIEALNHTFYNLMPKERKKVGDILGRK